MAKLLSVVFLILLARTISGMPQQRRDVGELAISLTEPSGVITSPGYPNSYNSQSSESWRLRVANAQFYTLDFTDMDLDTGGCYDYIVIYDDSDYTAPGMTICNKPSAPIRVNSNKITVSFVTGSAFAAESRGIGFRLVYATNGDSVTTTTEAPPVTTTTSQVITSGPTDGETSTPPQSSTTPPPTTPVVTEPEPTSSPGGSFPPGSQDDSQCGNPVVKPQISGFDYEAQGEDVSGYRSVSGKVVNGEEVVPHSWPWQVSLQGSYGSAYCGGTLIHPQWVVTAAHCAALIFIGTYGSDQVGLGMHDKRVAESSRQLIDIVAVHVHPGYDNPDRSHDVALVKMAEPAVLNEHVSLACEAHAEWSFPAGMECVVTGWGVTAEGGNVGTNILQQAPIPLLSDQACFDLYQQANLDTTSDMQCAGGQGKGACNGDSGGPLNCYVNGRWYHMGIVSFGEANCDTEIAGVFARVAELRSFIDDIMERFS